MQLLVVYECSINSYTVFCYTAAAGGGALGTVFLVGISIAIVCVACRKLSKLESKNGLKLSICAPNAECSTALELTNNVAYVTTGSSLTPALGADVNMEHRLYEEILSEHTHTEDSEEPSYAVIEPNQI